MTIDTEVQFRPARPGDGAAVFDITKGSVAALARDHYSADQIAGWMGQRTPEFYETLIAQGHMVIAERDGTAIGFVDAEPCEVTRLFILPEAAGSGLGKRLLEIGIRSARGDRDDLAIRVEATKNAEAFYRRHGFQTIGKSLFSHGLGAQEIDIVQMELPPSRP